LEAWAFKSWEKFLLNQLIKRNNKRNEIYKELQQLCPSLGNEFSLAEIEKLIDDIDEDDANITSMQNKYNKIKKLAKKCISSNFNC
jgi:Ca2+-binding EF-hand superfamily protein